MFGHTLLCVYQMVKRIMRSDLGPFSLQKHNHVCVKFATSFFLVGLAIRLLLWDSFTLSSSVVVETPPPLAEAKEAESPVFSFPIKAPENSVDFQGSNQSQKVTSLDGKGLCLFCAFG